MCYSQLATEWHMALTWQQKEGSSGQNVIKLDRVIVLVLGGDFTMGDVDAD